MGKIQSAECLSVVESLACCFTVDISSVEARHSSNREMSMLSNRGWVPSLQCLSAKFVCKRVGELSKRFKFIFKSGGEAPETQQGGRAWSSRPKINRGGGPWRAFCHERCKGSRFTLASIQQLSEEYRNLSVSEKQRYVEAGAAAVLARKHGHQSFDNTRTKRTAAGQQRQLQPGDVDIAPSGFLVATDRKSDLEWLRHYDGKDNFLDGYEQLKLSVSTEKDEESTFNAEDEKRIAEFEANTTGAGTVCTLNELGHTATSSNFQNAGSRMGHFISLEWFPPIANICQAG